MPTAVRSALPGRERYLAAWSATHGGVDTSSPGFVRGWLSLVYVVARPVARLRVAPSVITLLGVVVAWSVVPLVVLGGRWPLLVAVVVLVSGLLDGVDGAVALLTGRSSGWGAVLDAVADRCSDLAYVVGLLALTGWGAASPVRWLAAACAALTLLHEYVRSRAVAAGLDDVGVITVAERPTRVVITLMCCLAAGVYPQDANLWGQVALAAWAGTGLVGLVQLGAEVRRRLR
jgi:CDP-diacylglycerol--glycerol-3-phosphate 3-phosphatidyltransferase